MAQELEYEAGDECPGKFEGTECNRPLRIVEHERDPQFDTEPEGPVKEAVCIVCGVVDSV